MSITVLEIVTLALPVGIGKATERFALNGESGHRKAARTRESGVHGIENGPVAEVVGHFETTDCVASDTSPNRKRGKTFLPRLRFGLVKIPPKYPTTGDEFLGVFYLRSDISMI